MKKLLACVASAGFVFAAGLGLAGPAAADPLGGGPADDVVGDLQARGYVVEVQGDTESPLAECIATEVSGLSGTNSAGETVYVTVSCDDDHDE